MSQYGFWISSKAGRFGWIEWRNKIPIRLTGYMRQYENVFWGHCWLKDPVREQAFQELVEMSEEMGSYE